MKKILTYIAAGMMLTGVSSCSSDFFEGPIDSMPDDGRITMRYVVPELQGVQTRANEDDINTLTLLIFNGSGVLSQVEDVIALAGDNTTFTLTIDEKIRKDGNLTFMMIANAPSNYSKTYFEGLKTSGKLKSDVAGITPTQITVAGNNDSYLIMSGTQSLSDVLAFNSMALYRNSAKTTVNMAKRDASDNLILTNGKYELGDAMAFRAFGTATSSSICAGADYSNPILSSSPSSVSVSATTAVTSSEAVYSHATRNSTTGRAFVIVKAKAPGDTKDYYYRLDYTGEDGNAMNINPNNWYQFIVKEVKGKGFDDPAEAAKNPISKNADQISWEVFEHSPRVYNMVTDGNNYLGVSHEIPVNGNVAVGSSKTATFYVKVANKNDEYPTPVISANNFRFSDNWMSVSEWHLVTAGLLGDHGTPVDDDSKFSSSYLYEVTLNVSPRSNTPPGSLNGTVNVSWNGLTRDIPVKWNRTFDPSDLIQSASLSSSGANSLSSSDYFAFIDEVGGQVKGLTAVQNNGYARNEGFHFPLMYGDDKTNPATYSYTVVLKNQNDNDYKWMVEIDGDNSAKVIKDYLTVSLSGANADGVVETSKDDTSGPTLNLSFNSKDAGYNYGVGQILVRVAPKGTAEWTDIPLKIYHTGFFHQDNTSHAVAGTYDSSKTYTYYEVVGMSGQYWLDRNLGASSSELYIERGTGAAQIGTTAGRGAYYYVAKQVGKTPDFYSGICPPGYQIPYASDYDAMRKSSAFITSDAGGYNTSYFVTDAYYEDGAVKPNYFSKCRFYDASNKMGDSLSGYYWTQTTATGFEKDEIGRWLRGFVILGDATYQNNSRIDYNSIDKSGYALSLRCVSTHSEDTENDVVGFFVKGATHVFVYSMQGTMRVPATTWPGTPVGSNNTADAAYMNYRYMTGTAPEDLYVIFNYKESDGTVVSISKDGATAKITETTSPMQLQGWKLRGDNAPNSNVSISSDIRSEIYTNINSATAKYYWTISRDNEDEVYLTTGPVVIETPVEYKYLIKGSIWSNWSSGNWIVNTSNLTEENGKWCYRNVTVKEGDFGVAKYEKTATDYGEGKEAEWLNANDSQKDVTPANAANSTKTITLKTGGSNMHLGAGTYDIVIDPAGPSLTVTRKTAVVSDKYVIKGSMWSNYTSGDWIYNTTNLTEESGKWCYRNVTVKEGSFGIGKFAYTETTFNDTNQTGWYAASNSGEANVTPANAANSTKTISIKADGTNMTLGAGTYDIVFDPAGPTLTVTRKTAVVVSYTDLYLRGDMTGTDWAVNNSYKMETTDGVTYTLTVTNLGSGEFKFADSSWSKSWGGTGSGVYTINSAGSFSTGGQNMKLGTSLQSSTVTFTLNTTGNTLTVTGTASSTDLPSPATGVYRVYWKKGVIYDSKELCEVHAYDEKNLSSQDAEQVTANSSGDWYYYDVKPSSTSDFGYNMMLRGPGGWEIQTGGVWISQTSFNSSRICYLTNFSNSNGNKNISFSTTQTKPN